MAIIRSESDVRKWLSSQKLCIFRIEHRSGGTAGLSDAIILRDGKVQFAELKAGEVVSDGKEMIWRGKLRPSQERVGKTILENGGEYFVLVGRIGTEEIGVVEGHSAIDGRRKWTRIDALS